MPGVEEVHSVLGARPLAEPILDASSDSASRGIGAGQQQDLLLGHVQSAGQVVDEGPGVVFSSQQVSTFDPVQMDLVVDAHDQRPSAALSLDLQRQQAHQCGGEEKAGRGHDSVYQRRAREVPDEVEKKETPPSVLLGGVSLSEPGAMAGTARTGSWIVRLISRYGDRLPVPGWTGYLD